MSSRASTRFLFGLVDARHLGDHLRADSGVEQRLALILAQLEDLVGRAQASEKLRVGEPGAIDRDQLVERDEAVGVQIGGAGARDVSGGRGIRAGILDRRASAGDRRPRLRTSRSCADQIAGPRTQAPLRSALRRCRLPSPAITAPAAAPAAPPITVDCWVREPGKALARDQRGRRERDDQNGDR